MAEFLEEINHWFVVEVAATYMQKSTRLLFDRFDYVGMRVTSAGYGNAGHKIQKEIAINILDDHSPSLFDDQRVDPTVRGRAVTMIPFNDLFGSGARRFDFNVWYFHVSCFRLPFQVSRELPRRLKGPS